MRKPVWKVVKPNRTSAVVSSRKYFLTYEKNKIVECLEGTVGVFCFRRKTDAIEFKKYFCRQGYIIKLRPLGKVSKPKISFYWDDLESFYTHFAYYSIRSSATYLANALPQGTVCCDSVLVID